MLYSLGRKGEKGAKDIEKTHSYQLLSSSSVKPQDEGRVEGQHDYLIIVIM